MNLFMIKKFYHLCVRYNLVANLLKYLLIAYTIVRIYQSTDPESFNEIMFLLLGGTGVGYSVQHHHVAKLPPVNKPYTKRTRRFLIGDSIEGWADAIKVLMKSYLGERRSSSRIEFDYSDIRAKGALLVTSGGKAPGPQPLKECIVKITGILDSKEDGDHAYYIRRHTI